MLPFRQTLEVLPIAAGILRAVRSSDGRVFDFEWQYQNRAAALMNRLPGGAECSGQRLLEHFPALESTPVWNACVQAVETGETWQSEIPYGGEHFDDWFRVTVVTPEAEMIGVFFESVMDRKVAERRLVEATARERAALSGAQLAAEASSQAKDEFLAVLAHELRNPLAPIVTALHLLRIRGGAETERERNIIERQVGHLTRLVEDLLDVSRIPQGKLELRTEIVELGAVVAKAVETASPLIERHRHDLRVDVPSHDLTVLADPMRLAQVVSNLLTNAAKYTDKGGHISIAGFRNDDEVVLSVKDDGVGMPAEAVSTIFESFMQVSHPNHRGRGGLGLGLSIVRSLVALHGGSVSARSDGPGKGSEFTVRLPAADASKITSALIDVPDAV